MSLTHGVISDDKLIYSVQYSTGTRQLYTVPLPNNAPLTSYLDLALQHNLHTLWVVPGCPLNYWAMSQAENRDGWEIKAQPQKHPVRGLPDVIRHITANRSAGTWEQKRRIAVAFPQWNSYAWTQEDLPMCAEPIACLAAIHYLERALGAELLHNPGLMGRKLIEETNSTHSRPAWVQAPTHNMMELAELHVGFDLSLQRGVTPLDVTGDNYLLGLDKNSQYIAAGSSVELGTGNPVYINPEELELHYEATMSKWYDGKRPGYWRIDIADFDHVLNPLYRNQEWVTTPLLKLLYGMGARLSVREAYVWPNHHRILDKFSTKLWEARQSLKTDSVKYPHGAGRAIAYYSIKRIATAGLGMLANKDAAKYNPQWFRPDWYATVIEEAKARLIFKLLQVEREYGALPLAVVVDCVYYLTDSPVPAEAFPGMFGNEDKLGGWKVSHALPATYAVLECFKPGNKAGTASRNLKRLVAEGVRV